MWIPHQGHPLADLSALGQGSTMASHSPTYQSAVIFERFVDHAAVDDDETTGEQNEYDIPDLLIQGVDRPGPYLATTNTWG